MFQIGAGEVLLVMIIAFIVLGPKRLPEVARIFGHAVVKIRGFIQQVHNEINKISIEDKQIEKNISKLIDTHEND